VCAAWLVGALAVVAPAGAQQAPPVVSSLPASGGASSPVAPSVVYLEGDRLSGHTDMDAQIEGNAHLRRGNTKVDADILTYYQPTDQARASGNVRVNQGGNVYEGPLLELKVETFEGFFLEPTYHFKTGDGHGEASRADFLDEDHSVVHDATYTTCRRVPGPDWVPDWILRAATITFDNEEEVGIAEGAYVSFKDVELVPVPPVSFPLSDKRKSGLLPITIDPFNSINGMTVSQPYYWNIAPNRDATITPTLMSARGLDMAVEFRYLEPSYRGDLFVDYLGSDPLRNMNRWGTVWTQSNQIRTDSPTVGDVNLAVNIQRVSDDNYWMDFTANPLLTQRLLPGDVSASWGDATLSGGVRVLKWQTLQAVDSPIVPPYDRLPQLTVRYQRYNMNGFDWSLNGDYTDFQADPLLTGQPNAQRVFGLAQISHPWITPEGFMTPKLQLHTAAYQFDTVLANGMLAANSTIPTFSLDSGLVFERKVSLWDRSFIQTLEPRAFYVYTPYHDQSMLPLYDTGVADFNFASIYLENAYIGNDRISDNNLLTLGVSTRFLDAATGAQYANFGIAQRLRFEPQLVTINSETPPAAVGISDMMLGASVNLDQHWALDSTFQYNPLTDQSDSSVISARYNPGNYRVLNVAYRFQRDSSEQIDMSWQWPLNDFWGNRGQDLGAGRGQGEGRYYAVGRMNYSIDQSAMIDTVLGLEYDAGCWLGRLVYSRNQTGTTTAVDRIMFQIEFVGFSRLGIDPLSTLKQSIPYYQNLRETGGAMDRNDFGAGIGNSIGN